MAFGLSKVFSNHSGRIIEQWIFDAKSPLVSGATIGDLFKDGKQQVVFGTKDGKVICVNEAGKELWRYATTEQLSVTESFFVDQERVHSIDASPLIADVDMDGKIEVIVATELGMVYCLDANGKLKWKYDCKGAIKASVTVSDINMDGKPELIIPSGNKLSVISGAGVKLFEYISDAPIESVPAVLKSKKILIIFGNNRGLLTAITPAQEVVWKLDLLHKITAAPAFLSDAEEERMVIGTLNGDLFCISEHGEIVWTFKTRGSIYSAASIADINDDQRPEIIFGSCDNNIYALLPNGQRLWSYETDFWITSTPLITDIDGDGKPEVVAGSYDHSIYILDSQGTYVLDYVPGLAGIVHQAGHYANILTSDPGEQTGKKLYQYKTDGIVVGCSLLERHNAKPALVVNVKSGHVDSLNHQE
jgi:outer membrane protein assembly factor BamB